MQARSDYTNSQADLALRSPQNRYMGANCRVTASSRWINILYLTFLIFIFNNNNNDMLFSIHGKASTQTLKVYSGRSKSEIKLL